MEYRKTEYSKSANERNKNISMTNFMTQTIYMNVSPNLFTEIFKIKTKLLR